VQHPSEGIAPTADALGRCDVAHGREGEAQGEDGEDEGPGHREGRRDDAPGDDRDGEERGGAGRGTIVDGRCGRGQRFAAFWWAADEDAPLPGGSFAGDVDEPEVLPDGAGAPVELCAAGGADAAGAALGDGRRSADGELDPAGARLPTVAGACAVVDGGAGLSSGLGAADGRSAGVAAVCGFPGVVRRRADG
jgi:hypothetical protein